MSTYCVYMHINKINNKKYIGLTKQKPQYRWNNGRGYINSPHFYKAIQKYGWDNFKHIFLYLGLDEDEAQAQEKRWIAYYNTTDPKYGYNILSGGQNGPKDFTKMIEWQRTHKSFGQDNCHSKKVRCKETGDIFGSIREAGRWCNSTKIGLVCSGKRKHAGKHPVTNQLLSWEYADDNSNVTIICNEPIKPMKSIKQIICLDTQEVFPNASQAAKAVGLLNCSGILRCCKGERKTAGGKRWAYVEMNE